MHEALFYRKLDLQNVECQLCPHNCIIAPNNSGICRARKNIEGKLYAINYGKTISISIDPIEKKPLFHFFPNSQILSLGANSCNFHCDFCQNYSISQFPAPTKNITPEIIINLCQKYNLNSVAFTYTEPFTWFEFIYDSAKKLKSNNIKVVLVTNGFINPKPLEMLLPYIDAMNIDLKSFDEDFYKKYCGGNLENVLQTIEIAATDCHIEITNMIIPGLNDSTELIEKLAKFISEINKNIPLHLSRYFPSYKMQIPATDEQTILDLSEIASKYLNYVYLGNMIYPNNTFCPKCGKLLIERFSYKNYILDGKCQNCGYKIYGEF